ncbi:MAG: biotin/lipoyl-binding protein, partial [Selenomonadales bacterium]|nr:biotin/lipoyl-binding protein [Selenomonadales bacterium]
MNQQNIKRILLAGIIALSICLLFTMQQNTQTQTVSGIISMEEVKVTANVGGTLKQAYHNQGDTVRLGDILYELDSPELTEEIEKAKTIVAQVEDDLRVLSVPNTNVSNASAEEIIYQQAETKAKQFQDLYDQGAISRKMLIEAQTQRDIAHQALQTAR